MNLALVSGRETVPIRGECEFDDDVRRQNQLCESLAKYSRKHMINLMIRALNI